MKKNMAKEAPRRGHRIRAMSIETLEQVTGGTERVPPYQGTRSSGGYVPT